MDFKAFIFSWIIGTGCIREFNLEDGDELDITSPLYPDPYPEDAYCRWEIVAPPDRVLHVETPEFTLER